MTGISPNITKLTEVIAGQNEIITVADVGSWLNLSSGMITAQEDLIQDLIDSAINVVERYSWLSLSRKNFRAEYVLPSGVFSSFLSGGVKLTLERAPILSPDDVGIIEYLDEDGEYQTFDKGALTVDGLYDNVTQRVEQRQWASVYLRESVPYDSRYNAYKIRITFTSGFTVGTGEITDVPPSIKTALLMIVADYYTSRGDCGGECSMNGSPVPCKAKGMVDQYAIPSTVLGGSYTPSTDSWCML